MLNLLGRSRSACDGVSRRELLQAGGAGLFGLTLPAERIQRLPLGAAGEMAGHQGSRKKGEEGDPVLRIGDRELPYWRKEEEIETQHRRNGCDRGRQKAPCRGDRQNSNQIREARSSRIDGEKIMAGNSRNRNHCERTRRADEYREEVFRHR